MEQSNTQANQWKTSNIHVFWGEVAPNDHVVQFYENDKVFINTLEGFVGDGFIKDENVIVISTPGHLEVLEERLLTHDFDLDDLKRQNRFLTLDAKESVYSFMVNGWPDEKMFQAFVADLMEGVDKNRKTRVFGEMVSVLWDEGHSGATVQLENLWHRLIHETPFSLYCAYPKSGFTQDRSDAIGNICAQHSKILDGASRPSTEIYYSVPGGLVSL
jgi:hypothetical protein